MDILIGLFPSLMFGCMNLITGYVGGNPRQQNLGLALGAGTLSLLLLPLVNDTWSWETFILGFSGAVFWSCGQVFLLLSFKYQGVSRSMPVIVGVQLVQNGLIGVLLLGEWRSNLAFYLGFTALASIIGGIYATSWHEKVPTQVSAAASTSQQTATLRKANSSTVIPPVVNLRKGLLCSIISGMFYAVYPPMFQFFQLKPADALGPMGISIITCGLVFTFFLRKVEPRPVWNRKLAILVFPGTLWALGNFALLTSASRLGVATGFTLSQLGVVIATLGGIFILGEKRTKKEMMLVLLGITLVVSGGVLLGVAKGYDF